MNRMRKMLSMDNVISDVDVNITVPTGTVISVRNHKLPNLYETGLPKTWHPIEIKWFTIDNGDTTYIVMLVRAWHDNPVIPITVFADVFDDVPDGVILAAVKAAGWEIN